MKLLRYGPPGAEKPGLLDHAQRIRDLSGVISDLAGETLGPEGLAAIARLDPETLPLVPGAPRIGPPVVPPRNFVCIGLNYEDHAHESKLPTPAEPVIFLKSLSALSGPDDDIRIPRGAVKTDWEVELLVVMGTLARDVSEEHALDHVAGYALANDVSEREWQMERGPTWDKGKGFDSFGPIGPWLVTRDEVPDPQALALYTDVDGRRMQAGNTGSMIFPVAKLVSYVSFCMTLHPGDVIATGTPAGVGMGMQPPLYLRAGQTLECGISGLGVQRHRCVQN